MVAAPRETSSRNRRIAFLAWAWTLALFFIVLFVGLTILTIGQWLAGQNTMTNPVTDLGFLALGGVIAGAGFAVQLTSPERHIAGLQQALIGLLALAAAGLVGGREEPFVGGLIFLLAAAILAWLHPVRGDLLKLSRRVIAPLAMLSIVAAIPAAGYATRMLISARDAGPSCFFGRCAHGDRFAELAALAIAIALVGVLAAFRTQGWIVAALSAGASAFILGVASIVLPEMAGSLGQAWGVVVATWGILFAVVSAWESRVTRREMGAMAR